MPICRFPLPNKGCHQVSVSPRQNKCKIFADFKHPVSLNARAGSSPASATLQHKDLRQNDASPFLLCNAVRVTTV